MFKKNIKKNATVFIRLGIFLLVVDVATFLYRFLKGYYTGYTLISLFALGIFLFLYLLIFSTDSEIGFEEKDISIERPSFPEDDYEKDGKIFTHYYEPEIRKFTPIYTLDRHSNICIIFLITHSILYYFIFL